MGKEKWLPVLGYEGFYEVSDTGRMRSLDRVVKGNRGQAKPIKGRILKCFVNHDGYIRVALSKNSKVKKVAVHRLVAESFLENPNQYPVVNHIDEVKDNNEVSNLEWCTQSENVLHGNGIEKMMSSEKWKATRGERGLVFQDLETGEKKEYYSLREADRDGFSRRSIARSIERGDGIYKNKKWIYI